MNLLIILYISWSDEHCIKILVEVLILFDLGSSSDHWQVLLNIVKSIAHEWDYKVKNHYTLENYVDSNLKLLKACLSHIWPIWIKGQDECLNKSFSYIEFATPHVKEDEENAGLETNKYEHDYEEWRYI